MHPSNTVAMLVDWENLKASTTSLLKSLPDLLTLKKIARRFGALRLGRAYANWADPWHQGDAERIAQQGFDPVFVGTRHVVDGESRITKNSADFRLICDGMELLQTHPQIGSLLVVSGDFAMDSLLQKGSAHGREVVRVAVRDSASRRVPVLGLTQVFYDDWVRGLSFDSMDSRIKTAVRDFRRAVQDLRSSGLDTPLNAVKAQMRTREADFDEEALGIPTFRHLAYLAEFSGLVRIDATCGEPATAFLETDSRNAEGAPLPSGSDWAKFLGELNVSSHVVPQSL